MKILAVDDDELTLSILPILLAESGYTDVTVCSSPELALTKIESGAIKFDCFFFDISMPFIHGIELCKRVRVIRGYKETPIIMLTALAERSDIDEAFGAGATDYVTKPFDVTEIGARARVADKLIQARKVGQQHNAIGAPRPKEYTYTAKVPFFDPQVFDNVEGAVEYEAIKNYLNTLSRTGLHSSNFFAVKIDQAEIIHANASRAEFTKALTKIAAAIANTLRPMGFFLMSYAGSGHFLCVSQSLEFDSSEDIEFALQCSIDRAIDDADLNYDTDEPMEISVSVGKTIRPGVSAYQKADRVFRTSIARAEGKFDAKQILGHKTAHA
jgi:DNA-binding response OmpR family regulator